jgi:hypothetical protein
MTASGGIVTQSKGYDSLFTFAESIASDSLA